jgi:hypothetical protein
MKLLPFESVYLLMGKSITTQRMMAVLCCLLLAGVTHCTLAVYNQQALGDNNPQLLDIKYSIANFGFVP